MPWGRQHTNGNEELEAASADSSFNQFVKEGGKKRLLKGEEGQAKAILISKNME